MSVTLLLTSRWQLIWTVSKSPFHGFVFFLIIWDKKQQQNLPIDMLLADKTTLWPNSRSTSRSGSWELWMFFCAFRLLKHVNCIYKNNIQSLCVLSATCAVARWAALLSSWNTRSSGSSALLQNFYGSGCAHLSWDYLHSWRHGWKSWRWTEHQLLLDC